MLDGILKINREQVACYREVKLGYGDKIIFSELNLTLYRGQITMFCGLNGCGNQRLSKLCVA